MDESNVSYREAQEQFVSGHDGSTILEIFCLVSVAPAVVLVRQLVSYSGASTRTRIWLLIDFALLVMPLVCVTTVFSSHVISFLTLILIANASLAAWACGYHALPWKTITKQPTEASVPISSFLETSTAPTIAASENTCEITVRNRTPSVSQCIDFPKDSNTAHKVLASCSSTLLNSQLFSSRRQPFVTTFRAYVNIATAVCILGVDFVIFPRRFAKTESYGTGLMDAGVGAFVVSNAIVSLEARGKVPVSRSFRNALLRIGQCTVSTAPLWVLGVCRLIAIKGTDYHEHVTEYGVHWNFFFTLAVVKVLSSIILCFVPANKSWIVSVVIGGSYQWMLSCSPLYLSQYILHGRDGGQGSRGRGISLVDANREGLFSCAGYLAIYFAGVQLGGYLLHSRVTVRDWCYTFIVLALTDGLLWIFLFISVAVVEPVSRRMANLSYVIWIMAYNIHLVAGFLLANLIQYVVCWYVQRPSYQPHPPPSVNPLSSHIKGSSDEEVVSGLLEAVNYNGLLYFLFANLLTGVVNYSVSTIHTSSPISFLILTSYMALLSIISSLLYSYNISVKFW